MQDQTTQAEKRKLLFAIHLLVTIGTSYTRYQHTSPPEWLESLEAILWAAIIIHAFSLSEAIQTPSAGGAPLTYTW